MLQAVRGLLITDKVVATNGLGFHLIDLKCQLYVRLVHMPVIIAKHYVENIGTQPISLRVRRKVIPALAHGPQSSVVASSQFGCQIHIASEPRGIYLIWC